MTRSGIGLPERLAWRALLGDHPVARALRRGHVASPLLRLDFADVAVPNKAFRRVVRDQEFDVAELALMTFLMARSRGVPLRLFPVVIFSRNPLPHLVCRADHPLGPRDLMGRRVGVRAYATTTAVWTRAILGDRFGVESDRVQWVACEEGHVAGVADPANVSRAAAGADLVALLLEGAIDAAIVDPVPTDPRIVPVVPDAAEVCRRWQEQSGGRIINHVVVVRESLASDRERMAELFRLFRMSRELAGSLIDPSFPPMGLDANRRSLEVALEAAASQHLLSEPLVVEDLCHRRPRVPRLISAKDPMSASPAAAAFPRFGDVAHLGHLELFTPKPEASLAFFTSVVGLHETGRSGDSVYLRAWGDYERHTLKLTAHTTSGLGHMGLRVRDEPTLQAFVARLGEHGIDGRWVEDDAHGPAYRCATPDGHAVELYFKTQRFAATPDVATAFKNQPQRYVPRGIAPRRLDHLNVLARDVTSTRRFFHEVLGLRLTEQIIFDDGGEMGAWLSMTNKSYDVAITRDRSGASGRLHHFTYMMDSREDVLRAADILRDAGVTIETGPHKHSIGQTFFLYCYEPGGNRFEIGAGGYLILAPDWEPVVWTEAERAYGQAWGLQTVSTFHTHGTPPVPDPLIPGGTFKKEE